MPAPLITAICMLTVTLGMGKAY